MYILDEDNQVVAANDLDYLAWNQENPARRVVAKTQITQNLRVSTMFMCDNLSFGKNPQFFESMVFGLEDEEECKRYTTYQEALEGHNLLVCKWRLITQEVR